MFKTERIFLIVLATLITFNFSSCLINSNNTLTKIEGKIEKHYPVLNSEKSVIEYANPLIGTKGVYVYGRVTPIVATPLGMTHWVANTRESKISGTQASYKYIDNKNIGFLGTHKPAIWMSEYGQICIFPQIGNKIRVKPSKRAFKTLHSTEISTPYYYSTLLNPLSKNSIKAEMSATKSCGYLRFQFPENEKSRIHIETSRFKEFKGAVTVDIKNQEITGYNSDQQPTGIGPKMENFKCWFVVKFNKKFSSGGTWEGFNITPEKLSAENFRTGGYIQFATNKDETIDVKVATSFISLNQARINLEKEIKNSSFETIASQSKRMWETRLNKIKIEGATENQAAKFYSAMYHTLLYPRQFSEDGQYFSAMDGKIHKGVSYADYSLWDTFRAQHPLMQITLPDHINDIMQSLVNMYKEGGWLPKWPNPNYSNIMIGSHADSVLADAYINGFDKFDIKTAYEGMYKNAMTPPDADATSRGKDRAKWIGYEARSGLTQYKKLGYVASDKTEESVSRTLEFAYDDYCVAQMARKLNKIEDYNYFMERSKNYKNVYNKKTGFMAPRLSNGKWDPNPKKGFTEGSPWTYLFCAMHDIKGLKEHFGGEKKFLQKLNHSFIGFNYIHENEPQHHYSYLYNWSSEPWKTAEKVRKQMKNKYHNRPYGLHGDDDCGQMSAWYIFSALGFYPVAPASGEYAVGTPRFPKATIQFADQNGVNTTQLEIIANNVSDKYKYVKSITLNGKKIEKPFLEVKELRKGGKLIFEMAKIKTKLK